jgi:MHS family shikimate/dehydroshikimate transporter-like MFS transporter
MSSTPLDVGAGDAGTQRPKGMGKLVAATVVGNTIESYDYNVYGTLTALIFGALFFPSDSSVLSRTLAFATFFIGIASRPLGGILFGALGDRLGRKPMLMWSLGVMGVATFLIGCLPTYATIGVAAPILLVILRFIQGFGIGGEWGGAVTLMTEHAPPKRRGFFGSLVQTGTGFGIILAALTLIVLLGILGEDQLQAWGWRIPFLISAVLVALGAWVRLHIEESPEFRRVEKSLEKRPVKRSPLFETIARFPRTILLAIGMYASVAAVGYMFGVYIISYAKDTLEYTQSAAVGANLIGAIGYVLLVPVGGYLSDRFGRKRMFIVGAVAMVVGVGILFALVHGGVTLFYIGMFLAEGANGFIFGIMAPLFAELFPPQVRYTGISLGMQIATVLGGGLMPTIATLLVAAGDGSPVLLVGYVWALCALTIVCTVLVGRVREASVEGETAPVAEDD